MENQLSEILDNILGLLLLEGSYEVEETEDSFQVSIETKDAGRLIGARGESLDALQQIVNQIISKKQRESSPAGEFTRVVLDVASWRKQREQDLAKSAESWGKQVLESGKNMELAPQPAWQRRIVHMTISEMPGLISESAGESRDRHIVIKLKAQNSNVKTAEN